MPSIFRPSARAVAELWIFASLAIFVAPSSAQEEIESLSQDIRQLTERVRPSVVQIYASSFGPLEGSASPSRALIGSQQATGSGIILDPDGYILTNQHVIAGARRIRVRLSPVATGLDPGASILQRGGELVGAQVVGVDAETDLALLKVARSDLPHLEFGDSDEVFQGQLVFAFGSPLGLENSISFGVVSHVARQLERDHPMIYIQTDVAINPGNSGGPLVNARGEVVGVNTLIFSQSGGSEGLSFAAPSNIARTVFEQLRNLGRVQRGVIGAHTQTIDAWMAEALELPVQRGAILSDVYPGSPAASAGLRVGDILLSLDGKLIENGRQFDVNLYGKPVGERVTIEVLRAGQRLEKRVEVVARQEAQDQFDQLVNRRENLVRRLGLLCVDLDRDTRTAFARPPRRDTGVIVAAIAFGTRLLGEDFRPGDILYEVNREPITGVDELRARVDAFRIGQPVVFHVERGGRLQYVVVEME